MSKDNGRDYTYTNCYYYYYSYTYAYFYTYRIIGWVLRLSKFLLIRSCHTVGCSLFISVHEGIRDFVVASFQNSTENKKKNEAGSKRRQIKMRQELRLIPSQPWFGLMFNVLSRRNIGHIDMRAVVFASNFRS